MNEMNVDKFLLAHKVEIDDNGFSDRVMQSLPAKVAWQRRLGRIWNCIFVVLLAVFCWQTDVLTTLSYDIKASVQTMPLMLNDVSVWYTMGIMVLGLYVLVFMGGKKLNSL